MEFTAFLQDATQNEEGQQGGFPVLSTRSLEVAIGAFHCSSYNLTVV